MQLQLSFTDLLVDAPRYDGRELRLEQRLEFLECFFPQNLEYFGLDMGRVFGHVELQGITDYKLKVRLHELKWIPVVLSLGGLLLHDEEAHGLRYDGAVGRDIQVGGLGKELGLIEHRNTIYYLAKHLASLYCPAERT